jgi:hypothetical protein
VAPKGLKFTFFSHDIRTFKFIGVGKELNSICGHMIHMRAVISVISPFIGVLDFKLSQRSLNYVSNMFKVMKNAVFCDVTPCGFARTDVSEESSAFTIRMTRIGELGTTLAVTGNRRTLRRNTKLPASVASYG